MLLASMAFFFARPIPIFVSLLKLGARAGERTRRLGDMANTVAGNQFQEVHKQVRERLERQRANKDLDAVVRRQREEKADAEILDRERPRSMNP
jgi:hypothetical protein